MKEIKLSKTGKHKGKFVAMVDDSDYDYLNQWNWYVAKDRNTHYAKRNISKSPHIAITMHRVILNIVNQPSLIPDHRDRNGLNNQRYNLRICTKAQNSENRIAYGKSIYLGVCPIPVLKGYVYQAQIKANGKRLYLGRHKTEEDAARAYDEAAKKYFGEFANLNFKY